MQKGCKSKKSRSNVQYWMISEKKASKKGPKKGYCERSGFQLPFLSLFCSFSLPFFHSRASMQLWSTLKAMYLFPATF
jgi:hypothetical protein